MSESTIEIIGEVVVDGKVILIARQGDNVSMTSEADDLKISISGEVAGALGKLLSEASDSPSDK